MARKSKAKKKSKANAKAKSKPRKSRVTAERAKANDRANARLEEGLRETFPGSDPLAITDPTRSIKE